MPDGVFVAENGRLRNEQSGTFRVRLPFLALLSPLCSGVFFADEVLARGAGVDRADTFTPLLLPLLLLRRPRVLSGAGVVCWERPPRTLRCSVVSKSSENSSSESKIACFRRPLPMITALLLLGVFLALSVSEVAEEAEREERVLDLPLLLGGDASFALAVSLLMAASPTSVTASLVGALVCTLATPFLLLSDKGVAVSVFTAAWGDASFSPLPPSFFTLTTGVVVGVGAAGTSGSGSDSLSVAQSLNRSSLLCSESSSPSAGENI